MSNGKTTDRGGWSRKLWTAQMGLVPGAVGPGAGGLQARHHGGVGFEEEGVGSLAGPGREVVVDGVELDGDLVDAEDRSRLVGVIDPVPEGGAEVEAVVAVLGLDEDVRVQQVGHQPAPSRLASSSKVDSFLSPSIWKASR